MGILNRFADVMSANVNALLQKAESRNADKLLEKYVQDAKESLGQVKAETAAVMAEETGIGRKLSEAAQLRKKYEGYAVEAVKTGNDDDARKFLAYNNDLDVKIADYEKQLELAKANTEKMRQMAAKLTGDIGEASAKLSELKRKLSVAKQQEKLNRMNEKLSDNPLGSADTLMDAVLKRIDEADAKARLHDELNAKDDDIEDLAAKYEGKPSPADNVEDQLARLKAQIRR